MSLEVVNPFPITFRDFCSFQMIASSMWLTSEVCAIENDKKESAAWGCSAIASRKQVYGEPYRGFESLPIRQHFLMGQQRVSPLLDVRAKAYVVKIKSPHPQKVPNVL